MPVRPGPLFDCLEPTMSRSMTSSWQIRTPWILRLVRWIARAFGAGPPDASPRRLIGLAWPIVLSMFGGAATGAIDVIQVGHLGTAALAAAGLGMTLSFVPISVGLGIAAGLRSEASRRAGAKDASRVRLAGQALWLAGIVGLPVVALSPFAALFVALTGADGEIATQATAFATIRLVGAPLWFASAGLAAFHSAEERTRTTMVAQLLACATQVAGDLVLLEGLGPVPALGLRGAALAGILGQAVAAAFLAWRARPALAFGLRPDPGALRAVLRVGLPLGAHNALDVASFALFASMLVGAGQVHLAAHLVTARILSLSFLPGIAVAEATSVLVGRALGAGRPADARAAWASGMFVATTGMGAFGLLFVGAPASLLAPFAVEPSVAVLAGRLLWIAAAFQILDAIATVSHAALVGAGDTRYAMVAGSAVGWFVKLPIAAVLVGPVGLGAVGAWLGLAVEVAASAWLTSVRIRSGAWLNAHVPAAPLKVPDLVAA